MSVLERSEQAGVQTLTLNRPEKRNALNLDSWEALRDTLELLRKESARCVVIKGAGGAFCAGGDVGEASTSDAHYIENIYKITHEVVLSLYTLPCPTIAMIHGATVGAGLELALACDFRFATDKAMFAVGFTRFAAPPEAISAVMLPRLVGLERAKQFVFGEERWTGEQAHGYGLISEQFKAHTLERETVAFATRLANGPTQAFAFGKALMNDSYEKTVGETIADTARLGLASQRSEDAKEAIDAFVERREPMFTGR